MQRESYWDYMGRRMREDKVVTTRPGTRTGLTSIERDLYQRIEELERKVAALGSHPQQLEMEI